VSYNLQASNGVFLEDEKDVRLDSWEGLRKQQEEGCREVGLLIERSETLETFML
jgi:hypothetical protein